MKRLQFSGYLNFSRFNRGSDSFWTELNNLCFSGTKIRKKCQGEVLERVLKDIVTCFHIFVLHFEPFLDGFFFLFLYLQKFFHLFPLFFCGESQLKGTRTSTEFFYGTKRELNRKQARKQGDTHFLFWFDLQQPFSVPPAL